MKTTAKDSEASVSQLSKDISKVKIGLTSLKVLISLLCVDLW